MRTSPTRIPPLNSLRAFVAAARHLSFTGAGGELHVTPAAVSLQVRQLEGFLRMPLFARTSRGLQLTPDGQKILDPLADAFDQLRQAIELLRPEFAEGALTVSVAPSFASKWLAPRLDSFAAAHPQFDVNLLATDQLVDLRKEEIDLAIRYGGSVYQGLVSERLLSERVFPVCSPQLLAERGRSDPLALLARAPLLHDDSLDQDRTCPDWRMWLKASGIRGIDWRRGQRFNQSALVLEAAAAGRGIALAKATLAEQDLLTGRLLRLDEREQRVEFAYFLVYPREKSGSPKFAAFRDWLFRETGAVPAQAEPAHA
jgi:LysR family glycine cleavage system transcriptional activator